MGKKKKVNATIGDLLAFMVKHTYRLRAVEAVSRASTDESWNFQYGVTMHNLTDKEILTDLPPRNEADDRPYGR